MADHPDVLILDDGELDDLAFLLGELRVPYTRLRGGDVPDCMEPPRYLLVATPRRAGVVAPGAPDDAPEGRPLRLVSVEEDSNSMRDMLRRQGFQMLVRRPTHRAVWRLLVHRALYQGDERRRDARVPVGSPVSLDGEVAPSGATMVDISNRGCRLLVEEVIAPGTRVHVEIPAPEADGVALHLSGEVLRISTRGESRVTVAMIFDADLDSDTQTRLADLLNRWTLGDESLAAPDPHVAALPARESPSIEGLVLDDETDPAVSANVAVDVQADDADRRRARRTPFQRTIEASGTRHTLVLMGRDLSTGGLRVEALPELSVGDRFRIAIYAPGRPEPLSIDAHVARDDGEAGLALVFHDVDTDTGRELEKLVACLPDVETLADGEAANLGSVITEIVTDPDA